jgi:predicted TIM-barrel fold metal-dependent hydrolase
MIVDCHAHVFQHWAGPAGHPDRLTHARYQQRMLSGTSADSFRARDGARADRKALLDPNDVSWKGLRDVSFRVGMFGRLEFTVDDEDYYVQYMPVGMQQMEAPPELMLAQMTYASVDHAVLQAGGAYGAMTDYNMFAQTQYPARFTALAHLDEALAWETSRLAHLERAAGQGVKGIYFNFEGLARDGFSTPIDAPKFEALWDRLQSKRLVLCAEIGSGPTYDAAGYLNNVFALRNVLDRFPGIPCHVAMGVPVSFFARDGRWELPPELEAFYRRDDVWLEIMFPIAWGGVWDYPYQEAQPLIRDLRDRLGAEKLLWGSDMPNVERFCTYRQSLHYVQRYCDFLSASDMDRILGGNAARLYRIDTNGR